MRSEVEVRVRINVASAELTADLAAVEPRLRAERLRMLATIGLVMLRSRQEPDARPRLAEVALAPERPQAPAEVPVDDLSERKARLLARLGG